MEKLKKNTISFKNLLFLEKKRNFTYNFSQSFLAQIFIEYISFYICLKKIYKVKIILKNNQTFNGND